MSENVKLVKIIECYGSTLFDWFISYNTGQLMGYTINDIINKNHQTVLWEYNKFIEATSLLLVIKWRKQSKKNAASFPIITM